MLKILLLTLSLLVLTESRTSKKLLVQLSEGRIVGRYITSLYGKGIRAFMGIPYAEPPIGDLRFKDPVNKKRWHGVLKCQEDPPMCSQRNPFSRDFTLYGEENCLYLNVYSPETVTAPLPVMVWFHGGGFMMGSGVRAMYGPEHLLEHDVVFVGVNYRVGPLGFLSTGQEDAWGNFGLKDQAQALRWVKANIKKFGGNPDLVTIFGESAGGASVSYHMQSEQSKGLFHRAISQSGTNLCPWGAIAHVDVAKNRAIKLGEMFSCPFEDEDYKTMVDCLREVPADNITAAFYDFFGWDFDPMVPFPPVLEESHDGAFLTESPRNTPNVHGNQIPWMTGITSEEGALKTAAVINDRLLTKNLIDNWDRALPISLYYDHHPEEKQQEITEKITNFYFHGEKPKSLKDLHILTDVWSDGWFFHAMIDTLKMRFSEEDHAETFVYLFTHKGACSFTELFKGGPESYYGTVHAEELQYLFPVRTNMKYFYHGIPTEADKKLTSIMTQLWVNFATTGNPTPEETDLVDVVWPVTTSFPLDYMRIGNENGKDQETLLKLENDLYPSRAEFWDSLKAHLPAEEAEE